ncbi:hypothetical protein [Chitinophaga sp. MM2321]|uniref:hypothetical protein n=1 Tax=Chitinophaga sp. MM2321 TaxID=3137178 RepID=UPI0032D58835
MRIGIISEGGADTAVITNILKGITGLDSSNFVPIRPRLSFDNTTLQHLDPDQKGGWSLVQLECQEKKKIDDFFSLEDATHIIVHIDSAEAEQYGIRRSDKSHHEYCTELRTEIINKIKEWLNHKYEEKILYAIAIEEIDAWVLVMYHDKATCQITNPKGKLQYILNKKGEISTSNYKNYFRLTKPFSKKNALIKEGYLDLNCSLKMFYDDATAVFIPPQKNIIEDPNINN